MKKQLLFLFTCIGLLSFNITEAQCVPNGSSHPAEGDFVQDQWTAYAYNRDYIFFGWIEVDPIYRGYYTDTNTYGAQNLNFDSQDSWVDNSSPSAASNYQGCNVENDEHIVNYRRKGFPAGFYQLKVWHDDAGQINLDGNVIYFQDGVRQNYDAATVYLDEDSELSFAWEEDAGDSYGRLEFIKEIDDFGQGEWLVSVYNTVSFTDFAGTFTQAGISFSAPWPYNFIATPSDAPGYTGSAVGTDNSYVYRRAGFPCGFYSIDVGAYDDDAELIIDGVSVWSATGYSTDLIEDVWSGYLGNDSKIEMFVTNNGGGSTTAELAFNRLDSASANQTIWTGMQSSNTSDPANWCPALPDSSKDVYIPSQSLTANSPVLNADLSMGSLQMASDASLDLTANKLTLFDDFVNNGVLVDNHINNLDMQGANTSISGNGVEIDILDVQASGVSVAVNNGEDVRINKYVKITNGSLETNDKLTLACRFDDMTQRVAQIDNLDNASITGEVATEQCIPGRRAFRFVTSPVTTSTNIHQNWQEGATAYNHDPKPGYGTHITGSTTDQTNGLDSTPSGNPSMFGFDNAAQEWTTVTSTNAAGDVLEAGTPYYLMVRGSRAINVHSNTAVPDNTVLRATGVVRQGDIDMAANFNADTDAFNFFGNPYPAAVNMIEVMDQAANLHKDYYLWDPNLGGAADYNTDSNNLGGRGAYVTMDVETAGNSAVPSNSDANEFLQPGQAVFVKATGTGTPQMLFKESYKDVEANQRDVFRSSENAITYMDVNLYEATDFQAGETALDGFRIKFSDAYTTNAGNEDAIKFGNLDENIAVLNNGGQLAIDRRNYPVEDEIVPLFTNQYRSEDYSLTFNFTNWDNLSVYVIDYYLDTETAITTDNNVYSFAVENDLEASIDTNRFALKFSTSNLGVEDTSLDANWVLYPNPVKNGEQVFIRLPKQEQGRWEINITDMLGKRVFQQEKTLSSEELQLDNLNLNAGVYLVQLQSKESTKIYTKKLLVK